MLSMDTDRDSDNEPLLDATTEGIPRRRVLAGSVLFMFMAAFGVAFHAPAQVSPSRISTASQTDSQALSLLQLRLESDSKPFHPVGNFIAALGGSDSASGSGAEKWGLWAGDPGADGRYPNTLGTDPPAWYNPLDWWKEEHGLIMPNPKLLPAGEYKVHGDTTVAGPKVLTVSRDGKWMLPEGVTLDDVTHHPCKAFRYMGTAGAGCNANSEAKCTNDGSPVEYKVLIVSAQTVSSVPTGTMPKP